MKAGLAREWAFAARGQMARWDHCCAGNSTLYNLHESAQQAADDAALQESKKRVEEVCALRAVANILQRTCCACCRQCRG